MILKRSNHLINSQNFKQIRSTWYLKNKPVQIQWKSSHFVLTDMDQNILYQGATHEGSDTYWISIDGMIYSFQKAQTVYSTDSATDAVNIVRAPMTGTVIALHVRENSDVKKNMLLVELEAMKMQYKIESPLTGKVAHIYCKPKQVVEHDAVLIELKPS